MIIGQINVQRPQYYDRTSTSKGLLFSTGGVAPHGITVRGTYTVPANKAAIIEQIYCSHIRKTVAAPVGDYYAAARFGAGGAGLLYVVNTLTQKNAVGDFMKEYSHSPLYMRATDVLELVTFDNGTGGTVDYLLSAKIFEFDA